ncbi:MAG: YihA family ribosome biogenesis GTP-binding protein [Ignavibacterium sp.]|nr:YihA family ribosome biogenesis GTP-binding protein [Ignavibacterium sp.]
MIIKEAEFVKSSQKLSDCPKPGVPEYAFFGRSNVGKSSLINMVTSRKSLAKTSSTPGKTKLINHFLINGSWYITDLPGFGFAKVSKSEREKWERMIHSYLKKRTNLICLFLLIDVRHKPLANDLEYINWLGENQVPFAIVFTKSDKLTLNKLNANVLDYKNTLAKNWDPLPEIFITSSEKNIGRDEMLSFIEANNNKYSSEIKSI